MEREACLFSIKPEFAIKILSGKKKFEYRKIKTAKYFSRMIVYATHPIRRIIGEARVDRILSGTPSDIWNVTGKESGISQEFFMDYFNNILTAYAYCLNNPLFYSEPVTLKNIGIKNAPQSFIYIDTKPLDDFLALLKVRQY